MDDEPLNITASGLGLICVICTVGCITHLCIKKVFTTGNVSDTIVKIIIQWATFPILLSILYAIDLIVNTKVYKVFTDILGMIFIILILYALINVGIVLLVAKIRNRKSDKH